MIIVMPPQAMGQLNSDGTITPGKLTTDPTWLKQMDEDMLNFARQQNPGEDIIDLSNVTTSSSSDGTSALAPLTYTASSPTSKSTTTGTGEDSFESYISALAASGRSDVTVSVSGLGKESLDSLLADIEKIMNGTNS